MSRTITLVKGGQRYVFRCSGNSQAPLVEKLIRLARSRPDIARNVHLRPGGAGSAPDRFAAGRAT
jgi:hypothetical protein